MAYQSTFPGVNRVSKDPSGLLQLATILRRDVTPALNAYTDYKGKEITEKTDREAEIKARSTEAKSYATAVESGELDGTQSPYWQSVYDNVKGKNHGIQFSLSKQTKMNEWIQTNIAENPEWEDKDGSQFFKWSANFDSEYFNKNLSNESNFFKKGLDGIVAQSNANLGTSYVSYIKERQHTLLKTNLENVIIDSLETSIVITDQNKDKGEMLAAEFYRTLDTEGSNAKLLAGLKGNEFNQIALGAAQSLIEKYAIKGSPDADYKAAFAVLEAVKKYKRKNGSTLFNAETSKKWAELEQELYTEQESHENILDQNRKEALQSTYIKETSSNLAYRFTGGPMAISTDLSKEKAKIAKDAFAILMEGYFQKNNPDMSNELDAYQAKLYADNLSDELFKHYQYKDASQLVPFSIEKYQNRENEKNLTSLPLQFKGTAELKAAVEQWETNGTGEIADLLTEYNLDGKSGVEMIIKQQFALIESLDASAKGEKEDNPDEPNIAERIFSNIYNYFRDDE